MKTFLQKIPIKSIFIISALLLAGLFSLFLVSLYFLPLIVNSPVTQAHIQRILSSSLKRQVSWKSLTVNWSDGLRLSDLKLGVGAPPLLKTDVGQTFISSSVVRGADGRLGIDIKIRISNINAELAPSPLQKIPLLHKDPLTMLADTIQRIERLDLPLPINVSLMIDAAPVHIVYLFPGRTPTDVKQLRLENFSFHLDMPSLAAKPVIAQVHGDIALSDLGIGRVSLNAKVSQLVTKERRIRFAPALFDVDMVAPGTKITLIGGLDQPKGFVAHCSLVLSELLAIADPLIPPGIPGITGNVDLQLLARADTKRDLHIDMTVDGADLAATGGFLKTKHIGPLKLNLQQKILTDQIRQRVEFPVGNLVIPTLIDARWSAFVVTPSVPERNMELNFGPMRVDLANALTIAAPFLPQNIHVKELAGEMALRSLNLRLNGLHNNGDISVAGFAIRVPRIHLSQRDVNFNADGIEFRLEKLQSTLISKLPTKLTADLLWNIKSAVLSGKRPVSIQGGSGKLGLALYDIDLKSRSPRRFTASAALTQTSDLDRVSIGTQLKINNLRKQVRLTARADENGEIIASLPECSITIAAISASGWGKQLDSFPLSASLTAAGIRLSGTKGAKPTVERVSADISAGNFVQFTTVGALKGLLHQRAVSRGNVSLNLKPAIHFASRLLPPASKGDGVATLYWDIAADVPEKFPALTKNPLEIARVGLSLFEKLEFALKLDNISATVPSGKGVITINGLRTKPEMRLISSQRGESLKVMGGTMFSGLSGLPGTVGKLPSQHGSFSFNGDLSNWSTLLFREEFQVTPLSITHEGEFNINRIDTLLDEKQPFNVATMLKHLDTTILGGIDGTFSSNLKRLLPGFDLAGKINSAVRLDITAGREVALRCAIKTEDLGIRISGGTSVEGLRSDIVINRAYSLATSPSGDKWSPLSLSLVRPVAARPYNGGAIDVAARIRDDLRGDMGGSRSFSIRRVRVKTSLGALLEITDLEGDILLTPEKTGLSFFQADLLGGTLLASSIFDLKPLIPVIDAAGSFSNLDVTKLLPEDAKQAYKKQDSEITGEIVLSAPLTAQQRELFEQLRLSLNIRKIGADTIEKTLFALDPHERNEAVVAQRKMLKLGNLKGLRASAVDGAFSMEGEAEIKGIAIDLPKIERLRISELPIRQELSKNRKAIKKLQNVLDLVRADTLALDPKGKILLKRRGYEK